MSKQNTLCRYLEWDSRFFGRKIACVTQNYLSPEMLNEVIEWCLANGIDCIYFLANPEEVTTIKIVEESEFHLMDIRITLESDLHIDSIRTNEDVNGLIRPFVKNDIDILREIAGKTHRDTRFYHDAHFPKCQCNALYETWIEKSCHGFADSVFVSELKGIPTGYITCHRGARGEGQIGLLGVDPSFQGRDIGGRLVEAALTWFKDKGLERVAVVTQGRNVKAQRLYQRCGFLTKSIQLWYHFWLLKTNPPPGCSQSDQIR